MAKDWDAVAAAIRARLLEMDITQAELATRAGVALMTVRELQHNLKPRRRSPRTLTAVSEALGWPPGRIAEILEGDLRTPADAKDPILRELDAVKHELALVASRLDALERRLDSADNRA
ncbi:MAG: XRE family transcriptional regulator [Pseudonocardia sp.]|uniref:XRE family transcriptional regulator n=1 Tax=unclassified Pseudonocardia TaxID=2619320 RepID=UPI0008696831|nr:MULTISPECIES: XRE family transcriptional regulator [unclassified Pseudonocardia]MBN9113373.1 XRE family transcriptional regulator [Pseudonocardia sp.]ODU23277.1 MAG: hypothetical protein ABS80_15400 [Pseudonocardia sp. SCN 72-51]ODV03748.1 MAG: hypothetical protein ABT15_22230 [Pseudonocardia sp. SCN 73-27]